MITKTVGTGGDYATWYAAWSALSALSPLADDYNVRQTSNVTETLTTTLSMVVELNGHTLTITAGDDDWHKGDPTRGLITYVNANVGVRFWLGNSTAGTFVVERLFVKRSGTSVSTTHSAMSITWGQYVTQIIRNCMVSGNGDRKGDGIQLPYGYKVAARIYNCKAWGFGRYGFNLHIVNGHSWETGEERYCENCVAYDNWTGIHYNDSKDIGQWNFKNCISVENTFKDWRWNNENSPTGLLYTTVKNCADSDNTCPEGTSVSHNVTASDEFISTDSSNTDYLDINNSSKFYGSGATDILEINNTGIEGTARPNGVGFVSMGAHEPLVNAVSAIPSAVLIEPVSSRVAYFLGDKVISDVNDKKLSVVNFCSSTSYQDEVS